MTLFDSLELAVATLLIGAPCACVALAAVAERRNRGGIAVQITPMGDEAPLVVLDEAARGMEEGAEEASGEVRSDLESE